MRSITQQDERTVGPGDLDETITFEVEARSADGGGGFYQSWSTHAADVPAKVEPLYVAERQSAGAMRNVTQYRFTIYRDDTIDEPMRIVWGDRTFNIRGIRKGPARHLFMDIIAETGVGG